MAARPLVPKDNYTSQLSKLQDIERWQEALTGLLWAIESNPEAIPFAPKSGHIQTIKSEQLVRSDGAFVRLRIWIRVREHYVELLTLEAMPDD